jgi:DNA-binding winged helix-turn-helix (wHTH) protein
MRAEAWRRSPRPISTCSKSSVSTGGAAPFTGGMNDERGLFAPVKVGSRALAILGVLVERPGDLVSRNEIMSAVWPETAVEDSNLNVQIAALRRVLDERRTEGSCVQTVPGRGYRFAAAVTRVAAGPRADSPGFPAGGAPPLPDKPSLAVLPFQNMSGDP